MLNLNSIMIGSSHPKLLAKFYAQVFEREADMTDGNWYGWQMGGCFFSIGEHSEITGKAKEPQRVILNLETGEIEDEFERVQDLGATVIKEPYDMGGVWVATFADPDGNYFQLMTPWEDIEETPETYVN